MKRRKFVFIKIFIFLPLIPLIVMVAAVNYTGDPAKIFMGRSFEKQLAERAFQGLSTDVSSHLNYEYRYFYKEYVALLKEKKDVLVLGSSTIMRVPSSFFPRETFFNATVSGVSLNDFISVYGLFRKQGLIPATVLIDIDPFIFDGSYTKGSRRWECLKDVYAELMREISPEKKMVSVNISDYLPPRLIELFSFSYFQASLVMFMEKGLKTAKPPVGGMIVEPDGAKIYQGGTVLRTPAEVEALIGANVQLPRNGSLLELDPELKDRFVRFLALLRKDGVEIIFYLPPYHPTAYHQYDGFGHGSGKEANNLALIERYVRDVAKDNHIEVVGSYDPDKVRITGDRFYDDFHLRDVSDFRRIFRESSVARFRNL